MRAISHRQVRGSTFTFSKGEKDVSSENEISSFFSVRPHVDGRPAARHNHCRVSQWGRNPAHANTMKITQQHNVSALTIWSLENSEVQLGSGHYCVFTKNIHSRFLCIIPKTLLHLAKDTRHSTGKSPPQPWITHSVDNVITVSRTSCVCVRLKHGKRFLICWRGHMLLLKTDDDTDM